jgi:hypothetical protein
MVFFGCPREHIADCLCTEKWFCFVASCLFHSQPFWSIQRERDWERERKPKRFTISITLDPN